MADDPGSQDIASHLPPISWPLIDLRNARLMSPEWYQFFLNEHRRTGGNAADKVNAVYELAMLTFSKSDSKDDFLRKLNEVRTLLLTQWDYRSDIDALKRKTSALEALELTRPANSSELLRLRNQIAGLEAVVWGMLRSSSGGAATSSSALGTALTSAHIFVGNATNVATDTAVSGDITIDNAGVTAIGANKVTLAKFVQATTTKVAVGRNSASGGNFEEVTYSQILDWVGSAAQGDILYRGASTWDRLAAGSAGTVLTAHGSSSNPTWNTPGGGGGTGGNPSADLATAILALSPTGYWKCDDASSPFVNYGSASSADLVTSGVTHQFAYMLNDTTKYARFASSTANGSVTSALGTSPPLTGDWTVVAVYMPETQGSTTVLFVLGLSSSETEANNQQANLFQDTAGKLQAGWESGAGTDRLTISPYATSRNHEVQIVAIVKDGTADTITFYRNGRQIGAPVSYTTEPTGGTGSIQARIGYDGNVANGTFIGGHVAFWNGTKITAAQMLTLAQAAGLASGN